MTEKTNVERVRADFRDLDPTQHAIISAMVNMMLALLTSVAHVQNTQEEK